MLLESTNAKEGSTNPTAQTNVSLNTNQLTVQENLVERAANLGIRSGIRNVMSALEMTEFPNKVKLPPTPRSQTVADIEGSLPLKKNPRVPEEFLTSSSSPNVVDYPRTTQSTKYASFIPTPESSHVASFCLSCRRSFSQFSDFKTHTGIATQKGHQNCESTNELRFLVSWLFQGGGEPVSFRLRAFTVFHRVVLNYLKQKQMS